MKTNDELQKDVMEEIRWDPQLKSVASRIGVSANDGVITLSGMVDTYNKKLEAESAAQRVHGVKVVAVDLDVKVDDGWTKNDTEIAEAVKNSLTWHSAVNEDLIDIKVENGWVYLSGTVNWGYEKKAAEKAVENLLGVRGVTNSIQVKADQRETQEIKNKISSAFLRSATIDSSTIEVEILGSRVTLRGKVRSYAEKKEAEDVAWSSPGILSVENKIEIDTEALAG